MNQKENKTHIGDLVNTHGIKGEVRILSSSVNPAETFAPGTTVWVKDIEFKINSFRLHKSFILVIFEGVNNINDIEYLKGNKVYGIKEDLQEGEFFLADTIGFDVENNGEVIGRIESYMDLGPYDSYVVELNNGKQTNFPILDQYIIETNIEEKKIIVNLPKEFLE